MPLTSLNLPIAALFGWSTPFTILVLAVPVVFLSLVVAVSRRYKRCPSNRILVIYGRTGAGAVPAPWSTSERADMLTRAVHVASLHEAVYLNWCLLLSRRR